MFKEDITHFCFLCEKHAREAEKYKQALEEIKKVTKEYDKQYGFMNSTGEIILQKCEVLND